MHSHNTYPSVAQGLKCPMWNVPDIYLHMKKNNPEYLTLNEISVNNGLFADYRKTKEKYIEFAKDFIKRVEVL